MTHPLELGLVVPAQATPRPHHPLQLGRRARVGELEQLPLTRGSGHARERPHLGEGQLPLGHGRTDPRKLHEGTRGSHPLSGGPQIDPGAEGEPVGARPVAAGLPPSEPVELSDQGEKAVLSGMDVRGECSDLVPQILEVVEVVVGAGGSVRDIWNSERGGTHRKPLICNGGNDLQ